MGDLLDLHEATRKERPGMDQHELRIAALRAAIEMYGHGDGMAPPRQVLGAADVFLAYIQNGQEAAMELVYTRNEQDAAASHAAVTPPREPSPALNARQPLPATPTPVGPPAAQDTLPVPEQLPKPPEVSPITKEARRSQIAQIVTRVKKSGPQERQACAEAALEEARKQGLINLTVVIQGKACTVREIIELLRDAPAPKK